MFFLLTSSTLFFTEKPYVSLNKLQAMRPQGTIAELFLVTASGLQLLVSSSLAVLRNCWSLLLLTYLIIVSNIPDKFPNISREKKKLSMSGRNRSNKRKAICEKVLHSHENN
jgi:hypothetical protein